MVRRACVPPSEDFQASIKPVTAANTEMAAPPMKIQVAACHSSRDHVWSLPPAKEMTSNAAAKMYAVIGISVSGGCSGLPDQPRKPLNARPLSVNVGRIENFLMPLSPLFRRSR